jgi:hypothetical protein
VSGNYQTPITQTQTLTIASASSTSGSLANATAIYAPSATYSFSAPAVSSPAVSGSVVGTWAFVSSDGSVAALSSGTTFNILRPGTVTITGTFTPTNSSIASVNQTFTLTIGQGNNVISFAGIAARTVTAGAFTTAATASSSLAATITSATTSVCTIANGTVTLVGVGTCTLNANQAGDANYAAAS